MTRLGTVLLLVLAATTAGALEVERGDLRLVLHEDSSRFSLYAGTEDERGARDWLPLLFTEDPRTSALEVVEDNRVHRMGDGGVFSQTAERIENGARYVWRSPTLHIVQSFRFTRGLTSDDFDALEITVTITNRGEEPVLTGARLLLDTYLGERTNTHFVTPTADRITRETRLEPGPVNRYVASVPTADAENGLQLMLSAEGLTTPHAVVLANWKRLSESTWEYEVNRTRNFNRLPYSINDSALLVVYETAQLAPTGEYSIVAYVGNLSPQGYLPPQLANETRGTDPLLARLAEIVTAINSLLDEAEIDASRVAELQAELETLSDLVRGR
jgi:hypothetical protein